MTSATPVVLTDVTAGIREYSPPCGSILAQVREGRPFIRPGEEIDHSAYAEQPAAYSWLRTRGGGPEEDTGSARGCGVPGLCDMRGPGLYRASTAAGPEHVGEPVRRRDEDRARAGGRERHGEHGPDGFGERSVRARDVA